MAENSDLVPGRTPLHARPGDRRVFQVGAVRVRLRGPGQFTGAVLAAPCRFDGKQWVPVSAWTDVTADVRRIAGELARYDEQRAAVESDG